MCVCVCVCVCLSEFLCVCVCGSEDCLVYQQWINHQEVERANRKPTADTRQTQLHSKFYLPVYIYHKRASRGSHSLGTFQLTSPKNTQTYYSVVVHFPTHSHQGDKDSKSDICLVWQISNILNWPTIKIKWW